MPAGYPQDLAYANHTLYYFGISQLFSLDNNDGATPTPIANVSGWHPLIEGDRLVFFSLDAATQEVLATIPLAGGVPQTIATLPRSASSRVGKTVITPTDVYWVENGPSPYVHQTLVKRMSRTDGTVTDHAILSGFPDSYGSPVLVGDSLIVEVQGDKVFDIPLDGGVPRQLVFTGSLLGIDVTGLTTSAEISTSSGAFRIPLNFFPADGGPVVPFWSPIDNFWPTKIWPLPQSAQMVIGGMRFSDGLYRLTALRRTAEGTPQFLGCDLRSDGDVPAAVLFTFGVDAMAGGEDGAAYLVVRHHGGEDGTWDIIRVGL